jgi:hypothetical protein
VPGVSPCLAAIPVRLRFGREWLEYRHFAQVRQHVITWQRSKQRLIEPYCCVKLTQSA